MRPTSKRDHCSRGQGLVELALILPVMLFLLLGALDLGRVFYANIAITNAAKEAALRASTGEDDWEEAAINEARGGFVTVAFEDVSTVYSDSTNQCKSSAAFGATVTASVTAPFQIITPLIGALLGGQTKTLTAVAQADCRVVPAMALPSEPAPTPRVNCDVPNFVGANANNATQRANITSDWVAAGFTGTVTFTGSGNSVTAQSLPSGSSACTSSITLTR